MRKRNKGTEFFTLIELLVVIAVIAILAGLLMPALGSARSRAQEIACRSLLKGYGLATSLYADTYNDYFPDIQEYLNPLHGFVGFFSDGDTLPQSIARCPGDSQTEKLGRLASCTQGSTTVKVSIGGGPNLSDSKTPTSAGTSDMRQKRNGPQNRFPEKRCQWTDYQNPDGAEVSGAALKVGQGSGSITDSFGNYVFRHPMNGANGAFADGHVGRIALTPDIQTVNQGHDLAPGNSWRFPGNMTYPFGPRQLSAPGGTQVDPASIPDGESTTYY